MATINQLNEKLVLSSGDQFPIYSSENGDARKTSLLALSEYLGNLPVNKQVYLTQYSAPSVSGFTVQIDDSANSSWLVLTPTATMAVGIIKLPQGVLAVHGQEVVINTTQTITSLSVTSTLGNVVGAPTTLLAGGFIRFRFEGILDTWYRIG